MEKMAINRAKFIKVGGKGVPISEILPINNGLRPCPRLSPARHSFVEDILGPKNNNMSSIVKHILFDLFAQDNK